MKRISTVMIMGIALLLLLQLPMVAAETPAEKGLAIAMEADRRDAGFGDATAEMRMILKNRHGESSERQIRVKILEVPGDGDMSLSVFDTPKDVRGTAFLTHAHKEADDDQWLYLPALKRVKRISSQNKSGSFMGSEFSYEDIASQEIEKYTHTWLRDENYDGQDCFVSERTPRDSSHSGYTRQVVWLDKLEYRPLKIDYYDRKQALLKTLTFSSYRKYLDRFWRAGEMVMINHQSGKSTELIWTDYQFLTGLTENDFNKNSLQRSK